MISLIYKKTLKNSTYFQIEFPLFFNLKVNAKAQRNSKFYKRNLQVK